MKILYFFIVLFIPYSLLSRPVIVDHNSIELDSIPLEWINSAKENLNIAYGHTSHGSQITAGMTALNKYFSDGRFDFSEVNSSGTLQYIEGDGYGDGYMDHDCGYSGWTDETEEYLEAFPGTNVIIWSWCGQVNDVNLMAHYLQPMTDLEVKYPNVKFVYMTGHLEGLGLDGSLKEANDVIRKYCQENDKILFDFADIEKYDPDGEINYQQYYVNDECYYAIGDGVERNWAIEWIDNNPDHILTKISAECSYCAHSQCLNCVKKGIAAWYLWAKLAGWDNPSDVPEDFADFSIYPNPADEYIELRLFNQDNNMIIEIYNVLGEKVFKSILNDGNVKIDISYLPKGVYFLKYGSKFEKIIKM